MVLEVLISGKKEAYPGLFSADKFEYFTIPWRLSSDGPDMFHYNILYSCNAEIVPIGFYDNREGLGDVIAISDPLDDQKLLKVTPFPEEMIPSIRVYLMERKDFSHRVPVLQISF